MKYINISKPLKEGDTKSKVKRHGGQREALPPPPIRKTHRTMKAKEASTPSQIINGLKSALLKCEAFTPANVAGLEGLLDDVVEPEIQSAIDQAVKAERGRICEIVGEIIVYLVDDMNDHTDIKSQQKIILHRGSQIEDFINQKEDKQ